MNQNQIENTSLAKLSVKVSLVIERNRGSLSVIDVQNLEDVKGYLDDQDRSLSRDDQKRVISVAVRKLIEIICNPEVVRWMLDYL